MLRVGKAKADGWPKTAPKKGENRQVARADLDNPSQYKGYDFNTALFR